MPEKADSADPENVPPAGVPSGQSQLTRAAVLAAVVEWLEAERKRQLHVARTLGIPPSIRILQTVATNVTDTAATYEDKEVEASPFNSLEGARHLFLERERHALPPPPEPTALHEYYGAKWKMWCPLASLTGNKYPSAEAAIAGYCLQRTLSDYLRGLQSLERGDEAYASALAGNLLRLVESDHIDFVESVPLGGLRLTESPLELNGVTLRLLSGEEVGLLLAAARNRGNLTGADDHWVREGVAAARRRSFWVTKDRSFPARWWT